MGIMRIRTEEDDIHTKLMKSYKEVPNWWYAIGFVSFFALGVVTVEVWDTGVPVWSLLLAVALPIVYILPNGFIYAMTGQAVGSPNLLCRNSVLTINLIDHDQLIGPDYTRNTSTW